jgi:hypothetical protein
LENYEKLVADAFRDCSPLPFSNECAEHARVVMKHILKNARSRVCLYSGELPSSVNDEGDRVDVYAWDELISSARLHLSRENAKLDIKVKSARPHDGDENYVGNGFVNLVNEFPSKVTLEWGKSNIAMPDFMVSDTGAFRFEYERHQAIACANDLGEAKKLVSQFDSI